ncbi:hypothetical protein JTB14_012277 [Gonioctena quinquepunctata]|nr:hypothetical protein JTB14_012277 [Gonioctena quinquepunctata]
MTWCQPVPPEITPFNTLLEIFDNQFAENIFMKRFKFYDARRDEEETIEQWAARVRHLAQSCQFGAESDEYMRDRFIVGSGSYNIFQLFEDNPSVTFDEAVAIVCENREFETRENSTNGYDFDMMYGWHNRLDYLEESHQNFPNTFPTYV